MNTNLDSDEQNTALLRQAKVVMSMKAVSRLKRAASDIGVHRLRFNGDHTEAVRAKKSDLALAWHGSAGAA